MFVPVRFPRFSGIGDDHQRRSDSVAAGVSHDRAEETAGGALLRTEGAAVEPAQRAGAVVAVFAHRLLRLAQELLVPPRAGRVELVHAADPPALGPASRL